MTWFAQTYKHGREIVIVGRLLQHTGTYGPGGNTLRLLPDFIWAHHLGTAVIFHMRTRNSGAVVLTKSVRNTSFFSSKKLKPGTGIQATCSRTGTVMQHPPRTVLKNCLRQTNPYLHERSGEFGASPPPCLLYTSPSPRDRG